MTILKRTMCLSVMVGVTFASVTAAQAGEIRYVIVGGSGDGTSWANAYGDLQDALADADIAGPDDEVWVAAGTYSPGGAQPDTFQLENGVAVYGGFAAAGSDWASRDWDTHVTTLDGGGTSLHVVTGSGTESTAVLDGFTITGGYAAFGGFLDPGAVGAGMVNISGSPTLSHCTFSGNTGDTGAGMFNDDSSPTLTDCTFTGNTAYWGGGMYNHAGSNPALTNCTFSANSGGFEGGGMHNNASNPTLISCNFTGNVMTGADVNNGYGAGMFNRDSSPTLTDCTFSGNTMPLEAPEDTEGSGGGIANFSSSPSLDSCNFTSNSADDLGGGVYNAEGSDPTVTDCSFSGNSAYTYGGGGMSNTSGSNPTVTNCTFSGNTAWTAGGMWNEFASNPTLTDCTFSNNTAEDGGGGVGNYNADPSLINCTFIGNQANLNGEYNGGYGGGLINYFSGSSPPTLTNCIFRGNSALLGGGIHNYGASPTVTNCTFNGNVATAGGGIYNESGSGPTLTNCILWGDTPDEIGNDSSTETVTFSCVQGGYIGDGNIGDDPLFIGGGDLHLQAGSPCIDAGDTAAAGGITTDRDGNPRIVDGGGARSFDVDMGAYEFQGGPGPTPIPTVSEWGLIVMTLLLLTAATVVFGRGKRPSVA